MVDGIWVWLLPTGPTQCSMKRQCQPNGTMNSMMKQCQWKERQSKDRVKVSLWLCPTQKSLFSCAQPNTTKFDIGANLICRSKCKCTQHFNHAAEGKRGRERWRGGGGRNLFLIWEGAQSLIPFWSMIDSLVARSLTIFPLASFINGKT